MAGFGVATEDMECRLSDAGSCQPSLEAKQKLYPIITQLREKDRGSREFLGEMDESESTPETRLFIISNRRPSSQAGRRGFDPRLTLFPINNLGTPIKKSAAVLPR